MRSRRDMERAAERWYPQRNRTSPGEGAAVELVSNPGGPFTVTTGWTGAFGGSLSIVSDNIRVTEDGGDGTQARAVSPPIATVVGRAYRVTASMGPCSGAQQNIGVGNNSNGAGAHTSQLAPASTVTVFTFTATATITYFRYLTEETTAGATADLISLSVRLLQ